MGFKEFHPRNGETLIYSGVANEWTKYGTSKGGMLFLTNQRLVFQAHALNIGSKYSSYEISDIQINEHSANIKVTSNFRISFNITMKMKSGEEISFVVAKKQKNEWVNKIEYVFTKYIQSKIAMSSEISQGQPESVLAKIAVVQCESCGAFVVVTSGAITRCEYCGRPHTL